MSSSLFLIVFELLLIAAPFVCGFLCLNRAKKGGRSKAWFWFGFVTGIAGTFIFYLLITKNDATRSSNPRPVEAPRSAEPAQVEAPVAETPVAEEKPAEDTFEDGGFSF